MNSPICRITARARQAAAWLICVWLMLGSASAAPAPQQAPALDPVTLQLKWTHAFQFAGYYAALEQGYYRDAGLDVKIVQATPGVDPVSSVLEGRAQFGVGTSSLLLERKAGKPVVALAVIFQHSPYVLIARRDAAIQGIHDLIGKRIMLEPQSDEILAYLKAEGIPQQRFTRVAHSYDPQDLISGRVDAIAGYVTNQPYDLDLAGFQYQIFTPRSAGIDFYGDNLFTSDQELRVHPARVKAFRAASLRGWQYAMEHPEEIIDLILTRYSQQHTRDYYLVEARQMVPLLRQDLIEAGYMNPGRWRHIANVYAELGMMPPNFDLKGFLYDPNPPPPDLGWFYRVIAAAAAVILIVVAAASYVFRTNARLRQQAVENKRDKDALRRSEEALREASAIAKVGGWSLDISTRKITWTEETGRIHEVDPQFQPELEDALKFYAPEARPVVSEAVELALTQGTPFDLEVPFVTAKGNHLWVRVIGHCDTVDGRTVRLYGVFQDITARRRAETYRDMSREVLLITNEPGELRPAIQRVLSTLKTRTGFDAVGIRLQEGDDFPYFVQQGFSADFLLKENTLVQRGTEGGVCRDNDGKPRLECTCGLVISGKTDPAHPLFTRGGSFWTNDCLPLLDLPADQDPRLSPRNECIHQGYASVALVPIRDEGRIVGLIHLDDRRKGCFTLEAIELMEVIASHIGAALMRKRAEEALHAAKTAAETATQVKEQFLAKLSHELRTPLTPVLLVTSQWETSADLPVALRDDLAMVRRNLELEARLLDDLLDANRILYGKLSLRKEVVGLHQAISESLAIVAAAIQAKRLKLAVQLNATSDHVEGDPARMQQILWNLLNNAIKFTPEAGTIAVCTTSANGQIQVRVTDSGMGIAPALLPQLFSAFEQGGQQINRQYGGMGLGLSICKSMVEAHGGSISVTSEGIDKGATFTVQLPLTHSPQPVEPAAVPTVHAAVAGAGPLRILLVEDNVDTARIMSRLLRTKGYAVQTAGDVATGLACVKGHPFDLLVSDLGLPDGSGHDLMRKIVASGQLMKAIAVSGYGAEDDIRKSLEAGFVEHLVKPVNISQLLTTIQRVVGPQVAK